MTTHRERAMRVVLHSRLWCTLGATRRVRPHQDRLDVTDVQLSSLALLSEDVLDPPLGDGNSLVGALEPEIPRPGIDLDVERLPQQLCEAVIGPKDEHGLVVGLERDGDLGQGRLGPGGGHPERPVSMD